MFPNQQKSCCDDIIKYYSEGETVDLRQKKVWIEVQVCLDQINRLAIIRLESDLDDNQQFITLYLGLYEVLVRLQQSIQNAEKNSSNFQEIGEKFNFETIFCEYKKLLTLDKNKNSNGMLGYWVKRLGLALAAAAAGCAAGFKLSAVAAPVLGPWAPVVGGVIGGAVGFFGSRAALSSKEKLYAEINTLGEKFSKVKGFN